MEDDELFEFESEGGYGELFPDEEFKSFECSHCSRVIKGDEEVEWLDKKQGIFRCPECGEQLELE
ncbi:MAG: hypothetical protein PHE61_04980 [Candidatus Omnitrophica bacterium]|nr:hypothetical protein [Candidatus Omnitrophota bacterium]